MHDGLKFEIIHLPLADGNGYGQVSSAAVHHANEVGLPVRELVEFGIEVDVSVVDIDCNVIFSSVVPMTRVVGWEIALRLGVV